MLPFLLHVLTAHPPLDFGDVNGVPLQVIDRACPTVVPPSPLTATQSSPMSSPMVTVPVPQQSPRVSKTVRRGTARRGGRVPGVTRRGTGRVRGRSRGRGGKRNRGGASSKQRRQVQPETPRLAVQVEVASEDDTLVIVTAPASSTVHDDEVIPTQSEDGIMEKEAVSTSLGPELTRDPALGTFQGRSDESGEDVDGISFFASTAAPVRVSPESAGSISMEARRVPRRHAGENTGTGTGSHLEASAQKPFACRVPGCKKRYAGPSGLYYVRYAITFDVPLTQ